MVCIHCHCIKEINIQSYFSDSSIKNMYVTAAQRQNLAVLKTCQSVNETATQT